MKGFSTMFSTLIDNLECTEDVTTSSLQKLLHLDEIVSDI